MGRTLLLALLLLTSQSPSDRAAAKDITITLSDSEQSTLVGLLDLAVKAGGLKAGLAAATLVDKLKAAGLAPTAPAPTPEAPHADPHSK